MITPILMLGAGRMGGAILEGWARAGAFAASDLLIVDPYPSEAALAAERAGAKLNPPDANLAAAKTVILAVKPQKWLEAAGQYAPWLSTDAVIGGFSGRHIHGGNNRARLSPRMHATQRLASSLRTMPTAWFFTGSGCTTRPIFTFQ